ncbi:FtsX-like permease family protein [Streptomyces sp. NPDC046887]|uniref:ABC transporter permease n=1 Tax=Streptomyces sp. NPDC046887 TaxID=3155472 RepID=UPI0033E4BCB0
MSALSELVLGVRFAVAGGRSAWARTLMTALGTGAAVVLLLIAASVPSVLAGRDGRHQGREVTVSESAPRSPGSFLYADASTLFGGTPVRGTLLRPDGPRAPVPPGLDALPGPGEMAVSPALGRLLAAPEGRLLRERLPYRTVARIGGAGLVGPAELAYYAYGSGLGERTADGRADSFGHNMGADRPSSAVLLPLTTVALVVLLLPVLVFTAAAARFGGERRDRRLAAVRLVGADPAMVRRMTAGESLAGALPGLVAGAALFALVREAAGWFTVWDVNAFPADLAPHPALAAAVLVAVPLCAVAASQTALRGVAVEPLGVVRGTGPVRRRLWWRLVPIAAGLVVLVVPGRTGPVSAWDAAAVAAGALLTLAGVAALLPWLIEAVARRLGGGPVSWQLAVRRLRVDGGRAARAVSGVVVAAAGAIALLMLFGAVQSDFMRPTQLHTARAQLGLFSLRTDHPEEPRRLLEELSATEGVTGASAALTGSVRRPGPLEPGESFAPTTALTVADCASLRELARLPSCADGDVFLARVHGVEGPDDDYLAETARPGGWVDVGHGASSWGIPATARTVEGRRDPLGRMTFGVLATPGALDPAALPEPGLSAAVFLDRSVPDAAERARNAVARVSPLIRVDTVQDLARDRQFTSLRRGVLVAAALTMAVVALSLLVATVEQLRDRRRLLSSLVAFGTPRRTLVCSVLWQTALPVALGMALAVAAGTGLGALVLRLIDRSVTGAELLVAWPVAAVGAALVAAVTLLSLPALWRQMRPDGLRTE